MLNYLIIDSLNQREMSNEEKNVVQEKIVSNMINQVMKVNNNISEEQLKDIVGQQFTIVKYKNVTSDKEIRKIFKDHIDKYLESVEGLKI